MSRVRVEAHEYATIRPGDVIVEAGGDPVGPFTVNRVDGDARVVVDTPGFVNPRIITALYACTHGALTVERADEATPEPRARRAARRTVGGLTLVSNGPGEWTTLDGRHGLSHQSPGITEDERTGVEREAAPLWCPWSENPAVDSEVHAWDPRFTLAAGHLAAALTARGLLEAANTPRSTL